MGERGIIDPQSFANNGMIFITKNIDEAAQALAALATKNVRMKCAASIPFRVNEEYSLEIRICDKI